MTDRDTTDRHTTHIESKTVVRYEAWCDGKTPEGGPCDWIFEDGDPDIVRRKASLHEREHPASVGGGGGGNS